MLASSRTWGTALLLFAGQGIRTKAEIVRVMAGAKAEVIRCGQIHSFSGQAVVRFSVMPSGEIVDPKVVGKSAGSPFAACVEGAVRQVRFDRLPGPRQTMVYPFKL